MKVIKKFIVLPEWQKGVGSNHNDLTNSTFHTTDDKDEAAKLIAKAIDGAFQPPPPAETAFDTPSGPTGRPAAYYVIRQLNPNETVRADFHHEIFVQKHNGSFFVAQHRSYTVGNDEDAYLTADLKFSVTGVTITSNT